MEKIYLTKEFILTLIFFSQIIKGVKAKAKFSAIHCNCSKFEKKYKWVKIYRVKRGKKTHLELVFKTDYRYDDDFRVELYKK